MRRLLLVLVAACSSAGSPAPVTHPAAPIVTAIHTCADAGLGLEGATKGVRAPQNSVFERMRDRCSEDSWSQSAIDCFATMKEGELGRCARMLADHARETMFDIIGDREADPTAVLIARARLEGMGQVGIAECDRFVTTVANVLTCDRMPLESRVQLGNETADFWHLPTGRLPAAAKQKMADACGESLAALEQRAAGAGCMF